MSNYNNNNFIYLMKIINVNLRWALKIIWNKKNNIELEAKNKNTIIQRNFKINKETKKLLAN